MTHFFIKNTDYSFPLHVSAFVLFFVYLFFLGGDIIIIIKWTETDQSEIIFI